VFSLFFEESHGFGDECEKFFVGDGFLKIIVLGDLPEQMGAMFNQCGELLLKWIARGHGQGEESCGEVHKEFCVDSISFGQTALGPCKAAYLAGIDPDDGTTGGMSQCNQKRLIPAAGFANQDSVGRKSFKPAANRFSVLGICRG